MFVVLRPSVKTDAKQKRIYGSDLVIPVKTPSKSLSKPRITWS